MSCPLAARFIRILAAGVALYCKIAAYASSPIFSLHINIFSSGAEARTRFVAPEELDEADALEEWALGQKIKTRTSMLQNLAELHLAVLLDRVLPQSQIQSSGGSSWKALVLPKAMRQ